MIIFNEIQEFLNLMKLFFIFYKSALDVANEGNNSEIISLFSPVRGFFSKIYNQVTSFFSYE